METVLQLFQVIAALGLINVWIVRPAKATPYRGGDAKNMVEEFAVYGLPKWFVFVIGGLKLLAAFLLLLGLMDPAVAQGGAMLLALLMLGAMAMHIKVRDPIKKTLPSIGMLFLSLFIVFAYA